MKKIRSKTLAPAGCERLTPDFYSAVFLARLSPNSHERQFWLKGLGAPCPARYPKTLDFLCALGTENQGFQRIRNSRPISWVSRREREAFAANEHWGCAGSSRGYRWLSWLSPKRDRVGPSCKQSDKGGRVVCRVRSAIDSKAHSGRKFHPGYCR